MVVPANPDQSALARVGAAVRKRLDADPSVYKVPVESAELYALSGFLDADECRHLIGLIDAVAKPSQIFEEVYQENYRTSYSGDVDPNDSFVKMIERRLSDLLGLDPSWGESVQGQRYEPGQEFKAHCDWFDTRARYWKEEVRRGGQRSWTAMAFLNDVEEGGATEFPRLGISIPPQQGALLIWNNADYNGVPNDATLHAATPVVRGVKYVITKWFRTRPWR
ncbi:MAG: 2OG-Fe(II) oxygenase [Novosphingobium sp.]|nr:2OG-Fe(II) oxygenase [Novosphingobium sp.]